MPKGSPMKDYIETTRGYVYMRSGTSYTSALVNKYRRQLTVSPLVIGNHKTPNYHSFTKSEIWYQTGAASSGSTYGGVYNTTSSSGVIGGGSPTHLPAYSPSIAFVGQVDRCMEKIYDQIRGKSNFVVDLAEAGATLRMLKSTLSVRSLYREFFKAFGKRTPPKRYARRKPELTKEQLKLDWLTSKWLEGRYGWMPLVHSIYDALDTLGGDHILNGVYPCKGRSGRTLEGSERTGAGTSASPHVFKSTTTMARTEVCAQFRLSPEARISDWTSLNPVGIAWELLPLSFVADWIVNVSQQLSLWENRFLYQSQFAGGYTTTGQIQETLQQTSYSQNHGFAYWPNGSYQDKNPAGMERYSVSSKRRDVSKIRNMLSSLPFPSGVRLNVSFNAKRQMDAAALLHTFVGKASRSAVRA